MNTNCTHQDGAVISFTASTDLIRALDKASGEALASRASTARKLVVEALRRAGHLDAEAPVHRGRRAVPR